MPIENVKTKELSDRDFNRQLAILTSSFDLCMEMGLLPETCHITNGEKNELVVQIKMGRIALENVEAQCP